MQPRPTLAVRAPKNPDDFVNGQRPAAERQDASAPPPAVGIQPPSAGAQPPAADLEPSPASSERLTARPKMRGMVRRASGAEVARVTVYISPDAALKLRRHCFENGLEISEVAGKAVERYVAKL